MTSTRLSRVFDSVGHRVLLKVASYELQSQWSKLSTKTKKKWCKPIASSVGSVLGNHIIKVLIDGTSSTAKQLILVSQRTLCYKHSFLCTPMICCNITSSIGIQAKAREMIFVRDAKTFVSTGIRLKIGLCFKLIHLWSRSQNQSKLLKTSLNLSRLLYWRALTFDIKIACDLFP